MSKSVLMAIQPQWCEKIASGKKTIEVRKTRPKLETPFKCYIYCTNKKPYLVWGDVFRGSWVTEFTHISGYGRKDAEKIWEVFNGKVIGEFVCNEIGEYDIIFRSGDKGYWGLYHDSCLSLNELDDYGKGKTLYGWHISDIVIYDEPKELSEFIKPCENDLYCEVCAMYREFENKCGNAALQIKRPPQSWSYVEEMRGD